jgi:hypothetical protein
LLPVAMIKAAFRTLLVPGVGHSPLLNAGLLAALDAAITMAAIAVRANEKDHEALFAQADSLPEDRFVVNRRHAPSQGKGLDNGSDFVTG